jgi:hypothetical protein
MLGVAIKTLMSLSTLNYHFPRKTENRQPMCRKHHLPHRRSPGFRQLRLKIVRSTKRCIFDANDWPHDTTVQRHLTTEARFRPARWEFSPKYFSKSLEAHLTPLMVWRKSQVAELNQWSQNLRKRRQSDAVLNQERFIRSQGIDLLRSTWAQLGFPHIEICRL